MKRSDKKGAHPNGRGRRGPGEQVSAGGMGANGEPAAQPRPQGLEKVTGKPPSEKGARTERVAKFLTLVGPDEAAAILRHLPESEIESVAQAIAQVRSVGKDEAADILEEFGRLRDAGEIVVDGRRTAYEMLERAFGTEKANRLLPQDARERFFAFLNDLEPAQLKALFREESTSVIALVLPYLDRAPAAAFLAEVEAEQRKDIVMRMATAEKVDVEVLRRVEEALRHRMRSHGRVVTETVDGKAVLAEILRHSDPAFEESLVASVEEEDSDLAEELRDKLFTIDMILYIEDRDLSTILRDFEDKEVALVMKAFTLRSEGDELRAKLLRNVSDRRRYDLIEEYKSLGPTPKSDINEAVHALVSRLKSDVNDGRLRMRRPGVDDDQWV